MADALKIEIDVASAKQALDALRASFQATVTAAEQFGTRGAAGIKKFGEAMAALKPIDSSVASSITAFNSAMQGLKAGAVSGVAAELNKLAKVDVAKVSSNVQALSDALANLKVPAGLDTMAATFGNLAKAAGSATTAIKQATPSSTSLEKAVSGLNREIINSVGFISGMGVSVGSLVEHFQKVQAASGGTINSISALLSSMGKIPGAIAVAAAAFLAFKGVQALIENLIAPIINVTQEFRAFSLALDAMRGAGAGTKALEELKGIAERTGTEIMSLTTNFKQFEASASASGVSAQQSAKMFEQFSGAFQVLGLSAQQTQLAFRAITQMMSKGTVQAEELRGQLGENVPGALVTFAQALGVSTKALDKMLKSGQVISAEVLPKVAELLEKRYGNALEVSLGSVVAQMDRLSNAWTYVRQALGQGNIGGIFGGVAEGLRSIGDAVSNTEGLQAFARLIGDLVGGALQDVLQSIGIVIGVFNDLANGISAVLPSWSSLNSVIEAVSKPITEVVTAFVQLASVIGQIMLNQFIADVTSIAKSLYDWVQNSQAAQLALTALTAVVKGLFNLLGGAVWDLFSKGLSLIAEGANKLSGFLVSASGGMAKLGDATSNTSTATNASAEALNRFNEEAKTTADSIVVAAYGMTSYAQAQAEASREIDTTASRIKQLQNEVKAQDASMRDLQRQQKDFTDSIRGENQALERSRDALQRRLTELQKQGDATDGLADTSVQDELDALTSKIKDNSQAIEDSNLAFGDRIRREQEYRDSMQESIQADQNRNAQIKEFGIALTDSEAAAVKFLVSMGQQKDAAVSLEAAIRSATQSMEERIQKMQEDADKQKELAHWAQDQIAAIKNETDAKIEAMKARGDDIELIKAEERARDAALGPLEKMTAGAIENAAALETVALAGKEHISVQEAASRVSADLAKEFGIQVDQSKLVAGAIDQMAKSQGDGKNKADELATANNKAGQSLSNQKDNATQLQSALDSVATKAGEVAGKIEASTETWQNFATPVKDAGEGMTKVASGLSTLSLSLPIVESSLAKVNEVLPAFVAQIVSLAEVTPSLGSDFPKFAEAMSLLNTNITAMAETLPTFAANLKSIGEAGEGANKLTEAFQALIDLINNSTADINSAAEAIKTLASAAGDVSTNFGNATSAAQPMIDALAQIVEAADNATEAFNRMAQAAEDALKAANAANSAASGSSDSGGTTDTSAQREGGYAGDRLQTQSINIGAFRNAPKFAEGISNTSAHPSRVPGGGIPSILHPNEAVVPLSRGRKIPVDVKIDMPQQPSLDKTTSDTPDLVRGYDALSTSIDNLSDSVKLLSAASSDASASTVAQTQTPTKIELTTLPSVNEKPSKQAAPQRITPDEAFDPARTPSASVRTDRTDRTTTDRNNQYINITVNATDADSFKRTQDQIVRELGSKIRKAERRGG